MHPDFLEFIHYAKKKGIGPIQFATNAYAMNEEISDRIIDSGLDFISFSLDTLDSELYSNSRLKGNLQISMDHVIYMSHRCRERRKKGLPTPRLQVSTIEIEEYMEGQEDFIKFWKQYADVVRVYYEHDDNGRFRNQKIQERLEREVSNRQSCRKVFTDMLIYWDGELALCNYDWRGGLSGLNISKMSLADAWNSSVYERVREMHGSNRFTDDVMCINCEHWRIDYMPEGFLGKAYAGTLN